MILVLGKIGEDDVQDIVSARFDPQAGTLTPLSSLIIGRSPDYILSHPHLPGLVYVATRSDSRGKISLVRVNNDGGMQILDSVKTGLNDPCHMVYYRDGLVVAHFLGSGVTYHSVKADGTFENKFVSPFMPEYIKQAHPRQDAPHCHQVIIHGDEIIVPDHGCNRVWRLRLENGFHLVGSFDEFEPGEGCRHGVVYGDYLYLLSEMSSFLTVLRLDTGKRVQRVPIYPPCDSENLKRPMLSSALMLRENQLICTNRRSPRPERDAICIFNISDGLLGSPMFLWPGLSHIRELDPSGDGEYLCVGGKDAGGVVVYNKLWKEMARMPMEKMATCAWVN